MITRWITTGPDTRVLDASLEWRPTWPAALLMVVLILAGLLVAHTYRGRRIELKKRWRGVLSVLRLAVVATPVLIMLQPQIDAHLERVAPKTLAVLLDASRSMSVRDGAGSSPDSRWQQSARAARALQSALISKYGQDPLTTPHLSVYLFADQVNRIEWSSLKDGPEAAVGRATRIGPAIEQVSADLGGRPNAGILLLSDGADNSRPGTESPRNAARELARAGVPVHTILVGSDRPRDLSVSVTAETPFAYAGDPVPLRARISHEGLAGRAVSVNLTEAEKIVQSRDVVLPAGNEPITLPLEYVPQQPGRKRVRVEVTPLPEELTPNNNFAAADIQVIDQPLRVLYVEHWPRWQYQFLRNAIQRDHRIAARLVLITEDPSAPAEERQAASFPTNPDELKAVDAFVIGDVAPQDLSPQQWEQIRDRVMDDGAGVVFIAGPRYMPAAYFDLPVAPLLPFEHVSAAAEGDIEPFKPHATPLGANHPIMRVGFGDESAPIWERLPNLEWLIEINELKPGAAVLAEQPTHAGKLALPLIVLQRAGRGSSLFVATDETWRWRYEVGNRYFYGFWSQAIQHVGMRHRVGDFQSVRIEPAAGTIGPDSPTRVTVSLDATGGSAAPPETITLVAERTEGTASPTSFSLRRAPDSPSVFEGTIQLPSEGKYRLFVEGFEDRGQTPIEVTAGASTDPELANPVVNPDLLRQVAELTGGQFARLAQLPSVFDRLDLSPVRYRWEERISLWDGWTLLAIFTVLLTVEWILRKWLYLP